MSVVKSVSSSVPIIVSVPCALLYFFVLITNRVMPNSICISIKPKHILIAINAWFSKVITTKKTLPKRLIFERVFLVVKGVNSDPIENQVDVPYFCFCGRANNLKQQQYKYKVAHLHLWSHLVHSSHQ